MPFPIKYEPRPYLHLSQTGYVTSFSTSSQYFDLHCSPVPQGLVPVFVFHSCTVLMFNWYGNISNYEKIDLLLVFQGTNTWSQIPPAWIQERRLKISTFVGKCIAEQILCWRYKNSICCMSQIRKKKKGLRGKNPSQSREVGRKAQRVD